ncbi:pre-rRNA processing, partial [Elasticomyces elasticus]
MDTDTSHTVDNEQKFWDELDGIVSARCGTHELIDDALRSYLAFTSTYINEEEYLHSEYDIARCCYRLLESALFQANQEYVRRQIVYGLLQEDDASVLHLIAAFLLYAGRAVEATFEMMHTEGSFPRLVELIQARRDDDLGLHRLLIELLYEMSRIQPLTWEDLASTHSNDASLNHVKLVLNEQYMCLAHAPPPPSASEDPNARPRLTNRILKLLSSHGSDYRTFGENLILLLNRESGLSPQLLILKLLYLLFTTPSTYEYFYTNDLHVLVDVIIRNLLDLDPGSDEDDGPEDGGGGVKASEGGGGQRALSHTYLRVLCPLLRNTQLAREGNHYKKEEVRKVLHLL